MEILWKGTVFAKQCGNCAFRQNICTRKLGKITVFYVVLFSNDSYMSLKTLWVLIDWKIYCLSKIWERKIRYVDYFFCLWVYNSEFTIILWVFAISFWRCVTSVKIFNKTWKILLCSVAEEQNILDKSTEELWKDFYVVMN